MIEPEETRTRLLALDAGGTMTDTFLVDAQGTFTLGKALTNYEDEAQSYMASIADAAQSTGLTSGQVHKEALFSIYSGTIMLNTLITRSGRKVGLLVTRGFEHLPYMERSLTWLAQPVQDMWKYQLHEHTAPLVDLKLVRGISERITGGCIWFGCHVPPGTVAIPLNEKEIEINVRELLDQGAQVIGIVFLFSYIDPTHERRAAEIAKRVIAERGVDMPVVVSSQICPVTRESARMKSVLFECYAAQKVKDQLLNVETAANADGFRGQLETLLAHGGVANIRYPRLYESVVSGPTGGILGGKFIADFLGIKNLVCCDLGGTSFDVGVIVGGVVPITWEPNFAGHRLSIPMVAIDSVGGGTGTVIHVEPEVKRISLGPESVGSRVGRCYKSPDITITDCSVVLGYLSPDYFLGGKVKLDREAALRALEERLARPLGLDVYEAAYSVLELQHSLLQDHLNNVLLSKGYNPAEFTLLVYGGAGPLHLWGVAEGMNLADVITVPWAAAFSAFGIVTSEYRHRYQKSASCLLFGAMPPEAKVLVTQPLNQAWQELEEQAYQELEKEGFPRHQVSFRYGIAARYVGQMFGSWEAPVDKGRIETIEDVNQALTSFERVYGMIYPTAARFPEVGYHITDVFLEALVPKGMPVLPRYELKDREPPRQAHKGQRDVFHAHKWIKFDIWEMDLLEANNVVTGPAIIEHPMTTLVVPPQNYVALDEHKILFYRQKGR